MSLAQRYTKISLIVTCGHYYDWRYVTVRVTKQHKVSLSGGSVTRCNFSSITAQLAAYLDQTHHASGGKTPLGNVS